MLSHSPLWLKFLYFNFYNRQRWPLFILTCCIFNYPKRILVRNIQIFHWYSRAILLFLCAVLDDELGFFNWFVDQTWWFFFLGAPLNEVLFYQCRSLDQFCRDWLEIGSVLGRRHWLLSIDLWSLGLTLFNLLLDKLHDVFIKRLKDLGKLVRTLFIQAYASAFEDSHGFLKLCLSYYKVFFLLFCKASELLQRNVVQQIQIGWLI